MPIMTPIDIDSPLPSGERQNALSESSVGLGNTLESFLLQKAVIQLGINRGITPIKEMSKTKILCGCAS